MKKYRFIIYLTILTFLIISCGRSIFGPSEVNDNAGTYGDIERALERAEDYYIGAWGDYKDDRLNSALTIYDNLLNRNDLNDSQRTRATRGYCQVKVDQTVTDPGGLIVSCKDFYGAVDVTTYEVTDQAAVDLFIANSTVISSTINLEILPMMYDSRIVYRAEEDYVNITIYNMISMGTSLAGFVNGDLATVSTNLSNIYKLYSEYETAKTSFDEATNEVPPDTTTASNAYTSITNARYEASNYILSIGPATNTILGGISGIVDQNTKMTNITVGSGNIITTSVNEYMGEVIKSLAGINLMIEEALDPLSEMQQY